LFAGVGCTSDTLSKVSGSEAGFQPAGRAPAPPPLDLVQDFVNTEIPEWARDDIATPEELAAWLHARGLLDERDVVSADGFVAARSLRAVLRGLALANTLGEAPEAQLRRAFDRAVAVSLLRFELDRDGRLVLVPDAARDGAARALGAILVRVLEAQASGAWSRLKACRKESCGWLFYDGSRNASSRWCSMAICGNRTKTAAYRRRKQAS
jgi:predicted RNA-binding Zn ribbon-like protein